MANDEQSPPPRPSPHSEPPRDLAEYPLPVRDVGPPWFRSHRVELAPVYFGRNPAHGRFNDPLHEFGVLYLGLDEFTAFIETFGPSQTKAGPYLVDNVITEEEVAGRCLCGIRSDRPMSVVDLASGEGLVRLQTDARLGAGEWTLSQRWSRALWEHPSRPDGLLYRSRHDPARLCLALFDRVAEVLHSDCTTNVLTDPARLAAILDHYGYALGRVW